MVNYAISALAALALAPVINAAAVGAVAPTTDLAGPATALPVAVKVKRGEAYKGEAGEVFSFVKWVDSIHADPDADHLTPAEAYETYKESLNATGEISRRDSVVDTLLNKRAICSSGEAAYGPDAVTCINYLARLGGQGQSCGVQNTVQFCYAGNAQIRGDKRGTSAGTVSTNCNNVARGAGYVMDQCYRSDNTVQGQEYAHDYGYILVTIKRR